MEVWERLRIEREVKQELEILNENLSEPEDD